MSYQVSEQLLSYNRPRTPLNPQGIVIHDTDTPGATAQNEHDYFNSADRQASAHYFVDWTQIIQTIPDNEISWGCGPTGNSKFLNIEMCVPVIPALFQDVWDRTVWLVASLCVKYGWSTGPNVYSHNGISQMYHETGHTDPYAFLQNNGKTWEQLLTAIDTKIAELKAPVEVVVPTQDPDPDVYLSVRVRTSKADALVQQIINLGYACKRLDLA